MRKEGWYPKTFSEQREYLQKENDALQQIKERIIQLNDAQMKQRLGFQIENLPDMRARTANATIKVSSDPTNPFSWTRVPKNASEVANNVKIVSSNKATSFGGKYFQPDFGTEKAFAVSLNQEPTVIKPRHDQRRFSNMFLTLPNRGYYDPIQTRSHVYAHEIQHQMQKNLPLLDLSMWDDAVTHTKYYVPNTHFLEQIGSESLLNPFYRNSVKNPGAWNASPNEYNAESNAYRVVNDNFGRCGMFDPLDETTAVKLNERFGLNYDEIEALWNMGYKNGGKKNDTSRRV